MSSNRIEESRLAAKASFSIKIDHKKVKNLDWLVIVEKSGTPVGTVAVFRRLSTCKEFLPWLDEDSQPVSINLADIPDGELVAPKIYEFPDSGLLLSEVKFVLTGISGGSINGYVLGT